MVEQRRGEHCLPTFLSFLLRQWPVIGDLPASFRGFRLRKPSLRGQQDRIHKLWVLNADYTPASIATAPPDLPNALLFLFTPIYVFYLSPRVRAMTAARRAAGYIWPLPLFDPRNGATSLCVSHPAFDYPCSVLNDVLPRGPILQASLLLERADPEPHAWVAATPARRTVLIVLGSHLRLDERDGRNVFEACAAQMWARPNVQVLWKLQRFTDYGLGGVDGTHEFGDRLMVVNLLKPDPVAVLRTGRVGATRIMRLWRESCCSFAFQLWMLGPAFARTSADGGF
ncbi:hypothetical protein MPH_07101 [Macrophomina phaseolina MS6]|uniref:Uncharacterized protein n=1 Tax=Macrophomina phaseolina (strain MS6) TaxID=1126212 RepID=K2R088_MACPH|nr:hypothetical protein MPH_07101 [Macrophomina phaseolina MS6]